MRSDFLCGIGLKGLDMIQIFDGILDDGAQLVVPIALTATDQAALAKSIINGVCLLRVKTNALHGAATFDIDGIELSFYNPWSGEGTSGIVYLKKTFTASTTVDAGDTEYAMQDLSGLKELAVYPTIIKLAVSAVTLGGADVIDGCTIGIVTSNV